MSRIHKNPDFLLGKNTELPDLGGKRNFKEGFPSAIRGCHGQPEFKPRGGNSGIP